MSEWVSEEPAAQTASAPAASAPAALHGAVIGVLVGFRDDGHTPLVMFPGQPGSAAVAARATLDVFGAHIGRQVVLVFEGGDAGRPIIVGCLQLAQAASAAPPIGHVDVEADGERLVVTARERLVLRCGKASITLTRAGKILVEGTYVSNQSTGVVRIKGGSVQLN